jgi:hypothetical protein
MKQYQVELRGRITRDIWWGSVLAESEQEARLWCEATYPNYELNAIHLTELVLSDTAEGAADTAEQ